MDDDRHGPGVEHLAERIFADMERRREHRLPLDLRLGPAGIAYVSPPKPKPDDGPPPSALGRDQLPPVLDVMVLVPPERRALEIGGDVLSAASVSSLAASSW
jgi:hypothetical protein